MARSPQGRRKRAEPCTQPACGPLRRPMACPPPADLSMPLHCPTTAAAGSHSSTFSPRSLLATFPQQPRILPPRIVAGCRATRITSLPCTACAATPAPDRHVRAAKLPSRISAPIVRTASPNPLAQPTIPVCATLTARPAYTARATIRLTKQAVPAGPPGPPLLSAAAPAGSALPSLASLPLVPSPTPPSPSASTPASPAPLTMNPTTPAPP